MQSVKNVFSISLFMIVLYAPLVGSFFKVGVTSDEEILSSELRQPAKLPEVNSLLKKRNPFEYIRELEQYYKDRFGFRKNMIQSYSIAKVFWLGESSSSNVILGKKGWFFLSKAANQNELNYYRAINPYTEEELTTCKFILEKRKKWLAIKGIHYLLVIAPNKTTIYSELLPESISRVTKESRLDQLISYMKQNSDVEILDLRSSLLFAKEKELMYHPRDTHWNDLGAFVAYQQIVNSFSDSYPRLKQLSRANFKILTYNKTSDLTNMMGLNGLIEDSRLSLSAKNKKLALNVDPQIFYKPGIPKYKMPVATELRTSAAPRVVMFHDSFGETMRPFLSETFRRIVYLWQDEWQDEIDLQIVNKERPDIVIQEFVERKLNTPLD